MNIEEAIEILVDLKNLSVDRTSLQDAVDAMQLGIEALKGIKSVRQKLLWEGEDALLPGETLD